MGIAWDMTDQLAAICMGFSEKCRGKTSKSHGLENLWPYENVRLWRFYVFRHTPVTKNVQQQTVGIMSSL